MARKALIEKEKKKALIVERNREKRTALKQRATDVNSSEEARFEARMLLNKMSKNTCPNRLRNRCAFTGRSRGYLRKFGVSRITFREMASHGLIPGITKASW
jgi:small subunit ribosomal protein S14